MNYTNNLYKIYFNAYDINFDNEIFIFKSKINHLDKKINYSDYKIVIKFLKKKCLILKTGISMNLKKFKCKFKNEEHIVNTIKHLKISVEEGDIFEIELDILKKYFEIYIKIDEIDKIGEIDKIDKIKYIEKENSVTNLIKNKKIIIVLSKFIQSIGDFFKLIYISRGFECDIVYSLTIDDCLNSTNEQIYLIVYLDQKHLALPMRFIYYQVEQSNSKFLKDLKLLKKTIYMMCKAEKVWEYTTMTRHLYSKYCLNKLSWVPMPFYYNENIEKLNFDSCEYDIFFYGHFNERRKKILNELGKYFKLKEGFKCYGEMKNILIKKSKIILNLHFYEDSSLESCRINEILNYNKLIISENSLKDEANTELYNDYVIFVDEIDKNMSNINQMIKKIKYYLKKENYLNKMNLNKKPLSEKILNYIEI